MRSNFLVLRAWTCSLLRVFSLLMGVVGVIVPANLFGTPYPDNTFTIFRETPPDVDDNEAARFIFSFPSTNKGSSWGTFRISCEIPAGLDWNEWKLRRNHQTIRPDDFSYDSLQGIIHAYYSTENIQLFAGTELSLQLTGNCAQKGVSSGMRELSFSICRVPTSVTARVREVCLIQDERVPVTLVCPENSCQEGGMIFNKFDLSRINHGQIDRNQDGLPEHVSEQTTGSFYSHRLMYGDTVKGLFQGIVAEIDSPLFWSFGYASSRIEHGEYLEAIGAKLTIFDASSGRYLHCNDIEVSSHIDPPNRMFFYDITPAKLAESFSSFSTYVFEGQDSVWLETLYRVNKNLGDSVLRAEVENRFYLSDVENPTLRAHIHQCGRQNSAFTLLGFDFSLGEPKGIQVSYPYYQLKQPYQFVLGGSTLFSGSDPFPFEYRYFGHIKRAQVQLPPNYEIQSLTLEQEGEYFQLALQEEPMPTMDTINACARDTIELNLEEGFLQSRGGGIVHDGGFSGTINLTLIPLCEASSDQGDELQWSFTYAHSGWLNGGKESRWYHKAPDLVSYRNPKLSLETYDPNCQLVNQSLSWIVSIDNPTENPLAAHSWMHIFIPDSSIVLQSLVDMMSGDTLVKFNDIFRLGTILPGKKMLYEVTITYTDIPPEFLTVYAGFGCNGYPNEFHPKSCQYKDIDLFYEVPNKESKTEGKEPDLKVVNLDIRKW